MVSSDSQEAMDAAKRAVKEFMTRNGHHDTQVHEIVKPAIYHETISRSEKEEVVTVIDRELHQDHFHTSIQPVTDSETLEEQHHSQVHPVEKRTFEHEDLAEVQRRLDAEQAKFRDTTLHVEGEHTREVVPVATSEHIHHHVHEIIQPVVNKHTLEPHIVHVVQLLTEIHHQAAQHHSTSALPAVTMAEFKKQGGILTGREERYDWFEGQPRSVGGFVGNATNPSGSPVTTATQNVPGQTAQETSSAPAETKDTAIPLNQASSPPVPTINAPERRSSLPASAQLNSQPTAQPSSQPTAPEAVINTAKPTTPNDATPGAGPARPTPGRWSLLPMHFARSDGDAARAGHPPTRASAASPSVIQSVQAKAEQQQQAQRQASAARPPAELKRYPADK